MPEQIKIDFAAIGIEDFTFFLHLVDRDKLEEVVEPLGVEVAELATQLTRKQNRLSVIKAYLETSPQEPKPQPPPSGQITTASQPPPSEIQDLEIDEGTESRGNGTSPDGIVPDADRNPQDTDTQKRTRKERGSIVSRNQFIQKVTEEANDWLYRTEYEDEFIKTDFVDEDDNLKEVVRGFLRQAAKDRTVVAETLYKVAPTNKVVTATVFGLPSYIQPENQEKYRDKLREKAPKLGMFVTVDEATKHKHARGGQIELTAD